MAAPVKKRDTSKGPDFWVQPDAPRTADELLYDTPGPRVQGGPPTTPGESLTTMTPERFEQGDVVSGAAVSLISSSERYPFLWGDEAMPREIDDAEAQFGIGLYTKMVREEAILGAVLKTLKVRTFSNGMQVKESHPETKSNATAQQKADRKQSEQIANYIRAVHDHLAIVDKPVDHTLWNAMDCAFMGHKLAEMTVEEFTDGDFKGKYALSIFRTKPREAYAFVVNTATYAFRGVIGKIANGSIALRTGIVMDSEDLPNMIAPEKVVIFTLDDVNGDPRGLSWLRPCYDAWYRKQVDKIQHQAAKARFGGGMMSIIAPAEQAGVRYINPVTRKPDTLLNCIVATGQEMQNGRVGAYPAGTTVTVHLEGAGNGFAGYEQSFKIEDIEMVTCFLLNARALLEAQHGSKADSGASQDLLDQLVDFVRTRFAQIYSLKVIRWLVTMSYGKAIADKYSPTITFQATAKSDIAVNATAAAAMKTSGWPFTLEQYDFINTEWLGLPAGVEQPTPEDELTVNDLTGGMPGSNPAGFRPAAGQSKQSPAGQGPSSSRRVPAANGTKEPGRGAARQGSSGVPGTGNPGSPKATQEKAGGGSGSQAKEGQKAALSAGSQEAGIRNQAARFAYAGGLRLIDEGRAAAAARYKPRSRTE